MFYLDTIRGVKDVDLMCEEHLPLASDSLTNNTSDSPTKKKQESPIKRSPAKKSSASPQNSSTFNDEYRAEKGSDGFQSGSDVEEEEKVPARKSSITSIVSHSPTKTRAYPHSGFGGFAASRDITSFNESQISIRSKAGPQGHIKNPEPKVFKLRGPAGIDVIYL